MSELYKCLPTLKSINCLFYGTYGQLTAKKLTYPLPEYLQSWTTFSPGSKNCRQVSLQTTLPRLCNKCSGSKSATKLPDPFPQRSCLGAIWHRYNFKENRGEICIPSIRDPQAPREIYLCQQCGNVMFHVHASYKNEGGGMKQIFQDLLAEIIRLYYSPGVSNGPFSNIPVLRSRKSSVSSIDSTKSEKKAGGGWVLMIGNALESKYPPKIIQSLIPKFFEKSPRNSTTSKKTIEGGNGDREESPSNVVKTDISGFECSPNIWNKKALERNQESPSNVVKTDISGFECSPDIWNKKALERNQGRPIRQIPSQIPCLMNLRVPPWLKVENFPHDLEPKVEDIDEPKIDLDSQETTLESALIEEAILLERQRALSHECAEAVLTSSGSVCDLTENVVMPEDDKLDESDDKENSYDSPPILNIPAPPDTQAFLQSNNQINRDNPFQLTLQKPNPTPQLKMVPRRPYFIDPMYIITSCMTLFICIFCALLTVWCC